MKADKKPMPGWQKPPFKRGFTLLELLVTLTGVAMLALAAGALFKGGLHVLDRIYARSAQGAVATAGALLEKDLRNTFPFYAGVFNGTEHEIHFPGLIPMEPAGRPIIGTIAFRYDPQDRTLRRKTWPFPMRENTTAAGELLLANVSRFSFTFLGQESLETLSTRWQNSWEDRQTFPCAVRMDIWVGGDSSGSIRQTVVFPCYF